MYTLSKASLAKLEGVNPTLVEIVKKAITLTEVDFRVTEGLRTLERQTMLFHAGHSTTLRSKHINGYAVDVVALPGGQVSWEMPYYEKIAAAFKKAALTLQVKDLVWGGDWKSFKDGPHFQLGK